MTLGDRIVIMRDGWIMQIGSPQEVFEHPANLFVAGFIGSPQMNFFNGKLHKDGGKYAVEVAEATIPLADEINDKLAANQVESRDVTVGIRPEHILLKGSGDDVLHGKVDVSEMMGSEVHLHVSAAGKDVVLRVQTADLEHQHRGGFQYGAELDFTFRNELIHLFDPETEKNLI